MANRNTELHFKNIPKLDIKRSTFDMSYSHRTTFNEGELVPFMVQEVLPGDTFTLDTSYVIRMNTPVKPVMDNAYLDIYYFYIPNRLSWEKWPEFMGENKTGAWDEEQTEYTVPGSYGTFNSKTIADYMGIPTGVAIPQEDAVNALYFRDYVLIYNEWFRNQNLIAPINAETDIDSTQLNTNGSPALGNTPLLKAAKLHDYFTSALPEPQKGDPVQLSLGENAPVVGNGNALGLTTGFINSADQTEQMYYLSESTFNNYNFKQAQDSLAKPYPYISQSDLAGFTGTGEYVGKDSTPRKVGKSTITNPLGGSNETQLLGVTKDPKFSGLVADLTQATAINVNDIRLSFAIQRQEEKDARGGTRYIEIIKTNFGVTSQDARQQRPEYLGGGRNPINMQQVLQTSESTGTSPQGNTSAFSNTVGRNNSFTKSFTEHGIIMGIAVIRVENSYQNGLNKMFSRKRRYDYYLPGFANIGEQAILNKEIYMSTNTKQNNEGFGYQEAWAEYRYNNNLITGQLRKNANKNGNIWHYGLNFAALPTLSQEFNDEGVQAIDQTLSVQSTNADQFTADFYFDMKGTRPMPIYSIPGLIDHN